MDKGSHEAITLLVACCPHPQPHRGQVGNERVCEPLTYLLRWFPHLPVVPSAGDQTLLEFLESFQIQTLAKA